MEKINFASSKPVDQYNHGLTSAALSDEFAKGEIVSLATGAGSAAFPLFGRLRRDNYDQTANSLMGDEAGEKMTELSIQTIRSIVKGVLGIAIIQAVAALIGRRGSPARVNCSGYAARALRSI